MQSVIRAGLDAQAIDLFADRDLAECCPCTRIPAESYPSALPGLAVRQPDGPFLYTGALENHPGVVDAIAQKRPLWGNSASTLRAVRDPLRLATTLRLAGLPHAQVHLSRSGLPLDGSWLAKPLASSGGHGITPLTPHTQDTGRDCYYQQRLEGVPLAAIFLGSSAPAQLLGITRQILGRPGAPFAYAGSLGPWPVPPEAREMLHRIGQVLTREFQLSGLFGVDFLLQGDQPWLIEVNPRYTASVEVLERATGTSLLAQHIAIFAPELRDLARPPSRASSPRVCGKAILYADRTFTFPADLKLRSRRQAADDAALADVPWPGTRINAGEPILTVFARGRSIAECSRRLAWSLDRWRRRLMPPPNFSRG